MPTFRGFTSYADGAPGATDRVLFESAANAPRGVAPAILRTAIGAVSSVDLPYYLATDYGVVFDAVVTGHTVNITSGSAVVTRASGTVDWTEDDVGKLLWVVLSDESRWGGAIVSFQSATQVTLGVNAPVTETGRDVRWGTDCTAALNALAATLRAAGPRHGVIQLPAKTGLISGTIITGHGVRLLGAGLFQTELYAAPGTYAHSCMIRLDDPDNLGPFQHDQTVEAMSLNADNNADMCVFVNNLNENGGLFDIQMHRWRTKGFYCIGTSINFSIERAHTWSPHTGGTGIGLHISGSDRISIEGCTITAGDGNGIGILCDGGAALTSIISCHFEGALDGVRVDSGKVVCLGLHGHGSVTNLVRANGGHVVAVGLFPHWEGQLAFKDATWWGIDYAGGGGGIYASRWEGLNVTAPDDHGLTRQAFLHMGNSQTVPSVEIKAAQNTTAPFIKAEKFGGAALTINNDLSITGLMSPWDNIDGADQSAAPSGESRNLTMDVTNVPVLNGWWAKYRAIGAARTVTPASGSCVLPDGTIKTAGVAATIAAGTSAMVHADGTNLLFEGFNVT